MSTDIVQVTLTGIVTQQGEMKEFNGNPCANLRVEATPPSGKQPVPIEFQVSAWGKEAHPVSMIPQGSRVVVAGKLRKNQWQDKRSGQTREAFAISASSVQVIGGGGQPAAPYQQPPQQQYQQPPAAPPQQAPQQQYGAGQQPLTADDIPF